MPSPQSITISFTGVPAGTAATTPEKGWCDVAAIGRPSGTGSPVGAGCGDGRGWGWGWSCATTCAAPWPVDVDWSGG